MQYNCLQRLNVHKSVHDDKMMNSQMILNKYFVVEKSDTIRLCCENYNHVIEIITMLTITCVTI